MAYRIALADDSETIRKVIQLVLGPEGFTVAAYRDGEEALEAIALDPPDLVFADFDLPKMSGVLLCSSLKNDESTKHIPVILLAGAFEAFDEGAARLSGADDIIIKPFESKELVSKVKALVAKGASRVAPPSIKSAAEHLKASVLPAMSEDEALAAAWEASAGTEETETSAAVSADDELARQWAASMEPAASEPAVLSEDEELARQWAASIEPEPPKDMTSVPAAQLSEDEELARQWEASVEPAASEPAVLSEDEELARQWEASMAEEDLAPSPTEPAQPRVPFADVLREEILQETKAAPVILEPLAEAPIIHVEPVATLPEDAVVLSANTPDREEIRAMVRSAVDEAVAELLQSERTRIQGEIETALKRAVRDVAEALLQRELDRSVPLD